MGLFTYQIIDRTGNTVRGQMDADHEWMAVTRLRKMGYTVVDVNPVRESSFRQAFQVRRKVGVGELSLFSRQLAVMLDAGIPLTRSLFTLSRQTLNPTLSGVLDNIARNVEAGMGLSDSLKAYPDIFPELYVNMIRAGEVGGTLEEILRRLSEQLERDKTLRDSIRSASLYPIVVLSFATAVVLVMMVFIVPVFARFFPQDVALPLPTRILMAVSGFLRHGWYIWVPALGGGILAFRTCLKSPGGRRFWDRLKFKLPAIGPLFRRAAIARFTRTLSTLLAGGIPVLQALDAAGPASGNMVIAEAVHRAGEEVQEGKGLAGPLEKSGLFPSMVTQMVAVGEESGSLTLLLVKTAEFYEAEVAAMTRGLSALIEPVLIIIVGCLVGGIIISMYLPIFTFVASLGR
ncbi:MAG: type II secretion system F family protein [Bacillota bacterium]|nr:type II secretion system F family protein [Bacillota bacterium]